MTSPKNSRKSPLPTLRIGAVLFAAAFVCNGVWAQAAADTPTGVASSTAKKTERVVSDSWITTKVKSEILANSVTKAFKVGVKTKSGMVSLDGKLPTQDSIDLVKMIAEKVKGVKSVDVSALSIGT
jgi:hyperosmotically inducible protein